MKKKVLVVGAGIAGLTAAYRLQQNGFDVTVLEANTHVGGRMSTVKQQAMIFDKGAQFLSSAYSTISKLLFDTNLEHQTHQVIPTFGIVHKGKVKLINPSYPWVFATKKILTWTDLFKIGLNRFKNRSLSDKSLSNYSDWYQFDTINAAEWIKKTFSSAVLDRVFEPVMEGFYFQSPEQMSKAWALIVYQYLTSHSRLKTLVTGMGALPERLARELNVHCSTPVIEIEQSNRSIAIKTATKTFIADKVILATTASSAQGLYSPNNEIERNLLATKYSSTINIGIVINGTNPFDEKGLNIYGIFIPRKERKSIAAISNESCKYPPQTNQRVINVMLDGQPGKKLLHSSDEEIADIILPELDHYLPKMSSKIQQLFFYRWPEAEPLSLVGRSQDIYAYRRMMSKESKIILAGDYMSTPTTEGAAESGTWAANLLAYQ